MKKGILLIVALSMFVASILSSCKVVEPCPAYGNGSIDVVEHDNSSL